MPRRKRADDVLAVHVDGLATLNWRSAGSNNGNPQPSATLDIYLIEQASVSEVSSIEELQQCIAEQLRVDIPIPNKVNRSVHLRVLDGDDAASIGVPFLKRHKVDGEYISSDPEDAAREFVSKRLEEDVSEIALLKDLFDGGQSVTVESIPIVNVPVSGNYLKSIRLFDESGILRVSGDKRSPSAGDIMKEAYRATIGDSKVTEGKVTDTYFSLALAPGTDELFVTHVEPFDNPKNSFPLSQLPTKNFTPRSEDRHDDDYSLPTL